MKHLLKTIVICLILTVASALTVSADSLSDFDPNKPCSVKITLATQYNKAAGGADLVLYQVADAVVNDAGFDYQFTESFASCGLSLDDLESAQLAEDLYAFVQAKGMQGISKLTDVDGIAVFDHLRTGLYLFAEIGDTGEFAAITPFLVTLPRVDGEQLFYETEAEPKLTVDRSASLRVNKVWNDDGKKRPADIQVQVLRGDKVFETVTLSAENNWSKTWDNLVYADDWSVKEVAVPAGYVVTYSKEGMLFTVTNTEKLIQTGQTNTPIPFLAVGGLLLMVIGTALIRSGRKLSDEQE